MQNKNEYINKYSELIASVLAGEVDEVSLQEHEKLFNRDANYKSLYIQYEKTWNRISLNESIPVIDVDGEWNVIKSKLFSNEKKIVPLNKKSNSKLVFRIAAALIIGVFATFSYIYLGKPKQQVVSAQNTIIKKELPDGSEITLNHNSEIKYAENFNKNNRKVELKGDAYFNIKPDSANPFIVEVGDLFVKVLGTSFYINAHRQDKQIEVIVESGTVAVFEKGNESRQKILEKGEKAVFKPKEKQVVKIENSDINFLAWKDQKLKFDDKELYLIVYDLNRAYHSKIVIKSEEIKQCKLTVNFENKDLDAVLNILKEILDLKIKKKKDSIELKGKGCK